MVDANVCGQLLLSAVGANGCCLTEKSKYLIDAMIFLSVSFSACVCLPHSAWQVYSSSTPGQPPEYCTVFHHMVKAAGSTVKRMLRRAAALEGLPKPGARFLHVRVSCLTRLFQRETGRYCTRYSSTANLAPPIVFVIVVVAGVVS